jgi:hypothetical protein
MQTLSSQHQARELLNVIAMLTHCLRLPNLTDAERLRWPLHLADASRRLEALYAGGLSRTFRDEHAH